MQAHRTPPPAEAPDAALVAAAAAGSRGAWEALVHRHRRRVLVTLLAEGLSVDDARDVSQEAWARLWSQHQQGALSSLSFPGIVVTQARFLARDLKRRHRASPHAPAAAVPEATSPTVAADAALVSAQSLEQVRQALARQSPAKQQVFRLACDEGVAHEEIAHRVGLSTQRVRQIIWEVRTALRAALEEVP
jgi:RNA polymerase sigma-70 factor (ECF subfamily)